jgi:ABC-2 type transport system ATP-binding protein
MTSSGPVIVAERLTKRYGAQRGVIDLSFAVEPGEVFGFLGPNGAGKTTTIRTLLDLIRPTEGRVTILGMDPHRESVQIHRHIGYLPGEFVAYQRMTGREYLRYFAEIRGGVDPDAIDALASRLASDLAPRISSLSHGNKQKLGLIQAFMSRPDILILDEPTQGLDPIVQQEFHALAMEARAAGQTIFLSSHVMPEVERICDRVAIVREGRLIAIEDVGALKSKSIRTLEIHFAAPVPRSAFEGLPGVADLEAHGDVIRCSVSGAMDAVVKAAARFDVLDVESHEPSLEDIFLRFYGHDGGEPA